MSYLLYLLKHIFTLKEHHCGKIQNYYIDKKISRKVEIILWKEHLLVFEQRMKLILLSKIRRYRSFAPQL